METRPDDFDRLPPQSREAEMCLLASMMLADADAALFAECRSAIPPGAFVLSDHQILFRTLSEMADRGVKIDALTLREELIRRHLLDEIGGIKYLAQLLNAVPSPSHGPHYAAIVREKAILRGILGIAQRASHAVYGASQEDRATDLAQQFATELAKLTAESGSTEYTTGGEAAIAVMDALEKGAPPLVKLGIDPLDDAMGGVGRGEMLILGARPSMGKSVTCRQILLDAARQGTPTLLISLEESRDKIGRNLLSRLSQIDNNRIRRGTIAPNEWVPLSEGVASLASIPVYIADKAFTVNQIRSVASIMVAKHGVKLIVVDYLQRVRGAGKDLYSQVTNASQELSRMFKELGVAGVVAAQLNRDTTKRQNKRPGMMDLRESGQIEQDADQIIMLHREDYYRAVGESTEGETPDGKAEFIFVKFRDGTRGNTVIMRSNLRFQEFETMETADPFSEAA